MKCRYSEKSCTNTSDAHTRTHSKVVTGKDAKADLPDLQVNGLTLATVLHGVTSLILSQDSAFLYASAGEGGHAVSVWSIDKELGLLTFVDAFMDERRGIFRSMAVTNDDAFLYALSFTDGVDADGVATGDCVASKVWAFARNRKNGKLTNTNMALSSDALRLVACPESLQIDVSDEYVYIGSVANSHIIALKRDAQTGALRSVDSLIQVPSLDAPHAMALPDDGLFLYVAGDASNMVTVVALHEFTDAPTYYPTQAPTRDEYEVIDPATSSKGGIGSRAIRSVVVCFSCVSLRC